MSHDSCSRIIKAIRLNLHDKAGQLITSHGSYLSKKEILRITSYMGRHDIYSYKVIEYIYYISPHRFACDWRTGTLWSVLQGACMHGSLDTVKLLLRDSTIQVGSLNSMVLCTALYNGRIDIAKVLLADERIDPGADNNAPIRHACGYGLTDIVKILLADRSGRVDPACNSNRPLQCACYGGNIKIIQMLLEDPRVVNIDLRPVIEYYDSMPCKESTWIEIAGMLNAAWITFSQKIEQSDPL